MNIGGFFLLIKSQISHISVYQFNELIYAYILPFILLISLFICYLFFLLKKSGFSPFMAFIACCLLAINRLIWTANAADILFAASAVSSILCFWIYINDVNKNNKYFFVSAVFSGLAIVTRFTGFLLLLVIPLLFLFFKNKARIKLKKIIIKIIFWLIIVAMTVLILWPNFWLLSFNFKQTMVTTNYEVIGYQAENVFSKNFSILKNLSDTFLDMPIIDFFFLCLFVIFIKRNVFINFENRKILNTKILMLILIMLFFYLITFFVQRIPWTFRYSLPSWILLDIIIAQEIYREFTYLYKYPVRRMNLILPYLLFLVLLFFSFNDVREIIFLLRAMF